MKSIDYSRIGSMKELRILRNENERFLKQASDTLVSNLDSVKESLQMTRIFTKILCRSISLVSRFYFYRKVILLLRSSLHKRPAKSQEEKARETTVCVQFSVGWWVFSSYHQRSRAVFLLFAVAAWALFFNVYAIFFGNIIHTYEIVSNFAT